MRTGKNISKETMKKVWKLHKNGVDTRLISETLSISTMSVTRIVKIMATAEVGGDVNACGEGHAKQKQYAREIFGIEETPNAPTENYQPNTNEGRYLLKIVENLEKQTELLERLCSAWNV